MQIRRVKVIIETEDGVERQLIDWERGPDSHITSTWTRDLEPRYEAGVMAPVGYYDNGQRLVLDFAYPRREV